MLYEFLFTQFEEEDIDNIWFQQEGATCHTAEATLDILRPIGGPSKISVTPTSQEAIEALKDNIREAIGEIQLHTIDKVVKNWNDRVGHCMVTRGS